MENKKRDQREDLERGGVIVQLVDTIVRQAVERNASDIHLEPDQNEMRIRLRVDGILREIGTHSITLLPSLVSRIKVLASLDISEHRKPQDGRFQIQVGSKQVDLRVSTFPTISGENVVMRILDKSQIILGMEQLGMNPSDLAKYNKFIRRLYGLILVTGPNGSGKTTTLYSSINIINSVDKSIATLEDPIEYQLPRIRQTQIDPEANLGFALGLRSLLRQDPDIIMLGEIRDRETAAIAVHAALTGHLVFSTLHTNDAVGALTRLIDMGIEAVLISAGTIGVVAQRLVRKICPICRVAFQPTPELLNEFKLTSATPLFRGQGCERCNQTGYEGRTGIFEILEVDETIRELLASKAGFEKIHSTARERGMQTLREDGIEKALAGITTIEEVIRVTQAEAAAALDSIRV